MNKVLSKEKLEFINNLTLNEKSKNTIDKYANDIKDFLYGAKKIVKVLY